MLELAAEIAFILFSAFLAGSFGGYGLRRRLRKPVAVLVLPPLPELVAVPVAVMPVVVAAPVMPKPCLPRGLAAPRAGRADDLRRISGIGPRVERVLHGLGIYHYEQIARLNAQEMEAVSLHLGFAGRVAREQWTLQARVLASAPDARAMPQPPVRASVRRLRRPVPARRGWR